MQVPTVCRVSPAFVTCQNTHTGTDVKFIPPTLKIPSVWPAMEAALRQQWTLSVWSFLFFLIVEAFCRLPAPQNLSFVSFNLEHKLTWISGPGTPSFTRFRVQSYNNCGRKHWQNILNCSDLHRDKSCDLTPSFKNIHCEYVARVQAFTPDQTSNWSSSRVFQPLVDTTLGPPVVSLRGCGNCLLLQLSPPASRASHYGYLEHFFQDYTVNVSRTRDKTHFVIRASSGETMINYLEQGAEYCITALPHTILHNTVLPSAPQCAYTSLEEASTVPAFVTLLCAVFLLVALSCATLIYSGHLGHLHNPLPRALSLHSLLAKRIPGPRIIAYFRTQTPPDPQELNSVYPWSPEEEEVKMSDTYESAVGVEEVEK